jgi:sugar O-acyltransferase (sialic acid O-acetyltransferase NeuD family)
MIIYGAGGHAKVVHSCIKDKVTLFFDDSGSFPTFKNTNVRRYSADVQQDELVIIAIGDNAVRKLIANNVKHHFATVIANSAEVDDRSKIGIGSQVLHGAIVQCDAVIGKHSIVNTGASIDHDCVIGDFCHIAPQVTLCGNVTVGDGTIIGAGSTIIPGIVIGANCSIGAGSLVTKNISDNSIAVGSPARTIKTI